MVFTDSRLQALTAEVEDLKVWRTMVFTDYRLQALTAEVEDLKV